MCGISGIIYSDPARELVGVVHAVVADQLSRGPDHQAVEVVREGSPVVAFGHNRLSIIDLSTEAHQPMWDGSRRYALVFNGEIYNYLELRQELVALGHHFHTSSDSEVILEAYKAWGTDAVQRFNGMFAFALYDSNRHSVWLCRDRFGVKPLYYRQQPGVFAFASTGRALARHFGLAPDLGYLARGLTYWVYEDGSAQTQYQGLASVPPGHSLVLELADLTSRLVRYYDLEAGVRRMRDELATEPVPALVARVEAAFDSAIQLRLRADVPLGLTLSGGLDSSTIAAFTRAHAHEVIGFSYGSPDDPASEGPLVEELRQQLGLDVRYIQPTAAQLVAGFWRTLAAQDAPFTRGSQVAEHLVYQTARASGMRVLLGGQGSDEAFLGYRKFQLFRFRQLLAEHRYPAGARFLLGLLPLLVAELPKLPLYWQHRRRYGRQQAAMGLVLPAAERLELGPSGQADYLGRQLADFTRFSLPTLLRYEDRNSMGNSIESRLPFLDYRLVELAFALPDAVKVHDGYGKWILRQMVGPRIPDSIRLARYKRGFDVSQHDWIRLGLGRAIRERLHAHEARVAELLPPGASIDLAFSDEGLCHRLPAFAEATTLLWLAER